MTNEEKRQHKNAYNRQYRRENKSKVDRWSSRRKLFETTYADFIMKQVEMTEERRGWDV